MKYFTDGYTLLRNPSPVGGGFSIIDENNKLLIHERIEKVGFTNNEGEILGILWCLEICKEGDIISTDSMCAISWVRTGKSKSRKDLKEIFEKCQRLKNEKKVNLMWESREYNLAGHFNEEFDSGKLFV